MSTTGPVIWTTRPVPVGVAIAMLLGSLPGLSAGSNLDHFSGDVGLADLVVGQRQVFDQLFGVVGGVLHGDHPAGLLGRLRLENRLVDARRDVSRQQLL